jgi:hypothetical protein
MHVQRDVSDDSVLTFSRSLHGLAYLSANQSRLMEASSKDMESLTFVNPRLLLL